VDGKTTLSPTSQSHEQSTGRGVKYWKRLAQGDVSELR